MRIRGRIPRRLIMASQQQAGKVLPLSSKVRNLTPDSNPLTLQYAQLVCRWAKPLLGSWVLADAALCTALHTRTWQVAPASLQHACCTQR